MCPMNEYYVNDNFATRKKKPLWFADENEDKKKINEKKMYFTQTNNTYSVYNGANSTKRYSSQRTLR